MSHRRVVITGTGVVSALGVDRKAFWEALCAGHSGIRPMQIVQSDRLSFANGAEASDFDPEQLFDDREDRVVDRFVQFALLSAREAVAQSGLEWDDALRMRTAVITGSCLGGQTTLDESYRRLYGEKLKRFHPLTIPRIMANAGASRIGMEYGLRGPSFTVSTACSSANHALGMAFWMVRDGVADAALAGGSDAAFSLGILKAWDGLRVVSPDTCRPFCKDRHGLIIGEGGAILVMETLDGALARGAEILAEIVGFGLTADAHHLTMPSLDGPANAMRMALADGGLAPEEVGYVNAHGTATPGNDGNETAAVRAVFGEQAERLAMSSTKSMHGHALGAAGALEAVVSVMALKEGVLPPTANFTEADPECDLDYVPNEAREADVHAALSNSFAFGGLNAVLAFRRYS